MRKLSLVLCSALLMASSSLATPLDEAIKDIDVSGILRYRYDSAAGTFRDKERGFRGGAGLLSRQDHSWFGVLGFDAAIADDFRAFVQFTYDSSDIGYGDGSVANTNTGFRVRQTYLTYANEALATSILAGKMQMDTIWTDNSPEGLVGTGVKSITALDGLTLSAFVFDTFNNDGDTLKDSFKEDSTKTDGTFSKAPSPYNKNLYGVGVLGYFELSNLKISPELWLSYLNDSFLFYAFTMGVQTSLFDNVSYKLSAGYLGNSVDNELKKNGHFYNGNFFGLSGGINFSGFDASAGGLIYGDKNHYTLTTLEDKGNLGDFIAGEEIFSTDGSKLYGDLGRNAFGFVKAGYTFNEVLRIGADFVYGGTEVEKNAKLFPKSAGKKFEAVARVSYQYSPKLSFEAFYSYLNIDAKREEAYKNSTRLQVLYEF